ncbi:hypothetical protein CMI37_34235 [Candidatus Pacearchaeota archaeon]|nr:hypothetical protein [Candidatus Pacearchaeota archaeon]
MSGCPECGFAPYENNAGCFTCPHCGRILDQGELVLPVSPATSEETMLKELDDYDWKCVFAEPDNGSMGNCTPDIESVDGVSDAPVLRENVTEIIAIQHGENDGDPWVGLFQCDDGRYLSASGGCDYTGWD